MFKASYTSHYRAGLIQIVEVLEFESANTAHAPMVEALALIKRYKGGRARPGQVLRARRARPGRRDHPAELAELMYAGDGKSRRILRTVYECGVFQALREKLRRKEIWVVGAEKWRNPDPRPARRLRGEPRRELRPAPQAAGSQAVHRPDAELPALNDALGGKGLPWLKLADRRWTPPPNPRICAG